MVWSFALTALLLAQLKTSGTLSVEVHPGIIARVDYADHTGVHPDVADHGIRLVRQMWAGVCGQEGSCSHGPYTVSLTIDEMDIGLYCLGIITGQRFDVGADGSYKIEDISLGCTRDGSYFIEDQEPQIDPLPKRRLRR
jgi:hypothetical protein